MRVRISAVLVFVAVVVLALALAPVSAADVAGPCNDADGDGMPSGLEYATYHVAAGAHEGIIGHEHKPGSHMGFSACLGVHE